METEIFTCKYFKFGRNTTGLSQSHLRNFLACSIKNEILLSNAIMHSLVGIHVHVCDISLLVSQHTCAVHVIFMYSVSSTC